jgi:hypothetical protein
MSGVPLRLRVQLPDRPGALARVSRLLGETGASVIGLDIHELDVDDEGRADAVDEILVRAPHGWSAAVFAAALSAADAGSLLSAVPDDRPPDPVVRALRWVGLIVDAGVTACELELARVVGEICGATSTVVCLPSQAEVFEAGRLALARRRSVVQLARPVPGGLGATGDEEGWVLAVLDDPDDPRRVALAVRPAHLRFSSSEADRVEALLGLHRTLSGGVRRVPAG